MKNFIVLLFFMPLFAVAQKTHVVKAKETLYSLARLYNVHPRELAAYNNIPVETGLTLGQVIKIPANKTMAPLGTDAPKKEPEKKEPEKFVKKEPVKKETEKVSKPEPVAKTPAKKEAAIYHKVAKKETLYHISKLYNVTVDDIKKWNKITGEGVSEGTNLIIGYGTAKTTDPAKESKEEIKPVVKETAKVAEPEKTQVDKAIKTEPVKEEAKNVTGKNFKGGAFKTVFDKQVTGKTVLQEEKGRAGVFKSTSGWEDGKYYCLMNTAAAGTIVRITNPVNQKTIYAKVLDLIPDLKQNEGLIIRVSNAAAAELGTNSDNFESIINF